MPTTEINLPAIPKHPAQAVEPCPFIAGVYNIYLEAPITCTHETINRRCAKVGLDMHGYGHDVLNDRWYVRVAIQ